MTHSTFLKPAQRSQHTRRFIEGHWRHDSSIVSLHSGFTLAEILVTLAIAGLLTSLTLITFSRRWEMERLQLATKSLVAWLSERRSQAMASVESGNEGACSIVVDTNNAVLSQPESVEIASTSGVKSLNNICPDTLQSQALDLRKVSNVSDLQVEFLSPDSTNAIIFTFRGTTSTDAEIRLSIPPKPYGLSQNTPTRCIKVMKPLGIIRMGHINSSSGLCDYRKPYSLS